MTGPETMTGFGVFHDDGTPYLPEELPRWMDGDFLDRIAVDSHGSLVYLREDHRWWDYVDADDMVICLYGKSGRGDDGR